MEQSSLHAFGPSHLGALSADSKSLLETVQVKQRFLLENLRLPEGSGFLGLAMCLYTGVAGFWNSLQLDQASGKLRMERLGEWVKGWRGQPRPIQY